jgi:hypothetical protein
MTLGDRKSKLNMTHKWNHTLSATMNPVHFPPLVKQYYRPQLYQNGSHVEDSFLVSSFDATRVYQNPQFARLNDSIEYNSMPNVAEDTERTPIKSRSRTKVNPGGNNMTFAALFKNNSTFTLNNNQMCAAAGRRQYDSKYEADDDDDSSMNTCESEIPDQNHETRRCFFLLYSIN